MKTQKRCGKVTTKRSLECLFFECTFLNLVYVLLDHTVGTNILIKCEGRTVMVVGFLSQNKWLFVCYDGVSSLI